MNPGRRLERASLGVRKRFIEYLKVNGYYQSTIKDILLYLDKYEIDVSGPRDVLGLFSQVEVAKRHVVLAFRVLLNYYETIGYDKNYLDSLRNAIPKVSSGIDLKIPTENEILGSLVKLENSPQKYRALYSLLLDSGLRLVEGMILINNFKGAEEINGFYRCPLGDFRGNKRAYFGHYSTDTFNLIRGVNEKLSYDASSRYFCKLDFVRPKYLRKFSFDKMIELEVPESIADFIQGRVPRRIGAKHYLALARQASKYYPRYLDYIEHIRGG